MTHRCERCGITLLTSDEIRVIKGIKRTTEGRYGDWQTTSTRQTFKTLLCEDCEEEAREMLLEWISKGLNKRRRRG